MKIMRSIHSAHEREHGTARSGASHGGFATRRFDPTESPGGVRIYLREIGRIPPLTRQDEIDLAERIKRGDKKARDKMIKSNLRLVVKIAQDYAGCGLSLLDLISEGNIGLMKAVERFDPSKRGKLSTCASEWIRQRIEHTLAIRARSFSLCCMDC